MTPSDNGCTRREAVRRGLGYMAGMLFLPGGVRAQSQDSTTSRLVYPGLGRLRDTVTSYENDPFIVEVEGRMRCTCGCNLSVYTCRTTDFTCATSPAMHRRVIELVEQDKSADEILAAFVAQHGETVLMAPPKRGFNLAAYFVPGTLIVVAASGLMWSLRRRAKVAATRAMPRAAGSALSATDAARLDDALAELER